MRYQTTMLCGGNSMMLTPSEHPAFDMTDAAGMLGDSVLRASKDMVEFTHDDVKITLYPNGSLMFYHFTDMTAARLYADDILGRLCGDGVTE